MYTVIHIRTILKLNWAYDLSRNSLLGLKMDPSVKVRLILSTLLVSYDNWEFYFFQNHDYVIVSGARRKEQRWKPEENGQVATEGRFLLVTY